MFGEALLLPGLGMEVPLFEQQVLSRYLSERSSTELAALTELEKKVASWVADVRGRALNETSIEQAFNQRIMIDALGYKMHPDPASSLWVKPTREQTGLNTVPDAGLGVFADSSAPEFLGVLELKTPGTNLDKPQARKTRLTPVEQAFDYATKILGVRWVVVSDMLTLRLYSVESQTSFIAVPLNECVIRNGKPSTALTQLQYLFSHSELIQGGDESSVSSLLLTSYARKQFVEANFYEIYFTIRTDLIAAVTEACAAATIHASKAEILEAVQRLLDRMLFLAYCQDHPAHLIKSGTVPNVVNAARSLPGNDPSRVYTFLKSLFREVDAGSSAASGLSISAYNGELFKFHPIVDVIDLPNSLADKRYEAPGGDRVVIGVWGFEVFNFWRELDEHLLGGIFEQSLSDSTGTPPEPLHVRLKERRRGGIYYTHDILSRYAIDGAIQGILSDLPAIPMKGDPVPAFQARTQQLEAIRVIDPACGSGAFLVSGYRGLLAEWTRLREMIAVAKSGRGPQQLGLEAAAVASTQATLLRESLYGADLLPQATEITKLALWLRSARKNEKVADLGQNIVVADSLRIDDLLAQIHMGPGAFDIVMGNPPWGAEVSPEAYADAMKVLGIDPPGPLDSWEVFVLLSLHLLRDGGRLAFILPDTLFAPEKHWIRSTIIRCTTIERIGNLGMDWFGEVVRMGAVAFQLRKTAPNDESKFIGYSLTGQMRRNAIRGRVLLDQVQSDRGKSVSQKRVADREGTAIWVGQGARDDTIMDGMIAHSVPFGSMISGSRGEEISGGGKMWRCLGCGEHTVPPDRRKGLATKTCPGCKATLDGSSVTVVDMIVPALPSLPYTELLVDTEDFHRRYAPVQPSKRLRMDLLGFEYKDSNQFIGPKILVREAGVGITAALDRSNARAVRSTYAFKLTPDAIASGYKIEFLLAVLQSRTIHYYITQITNQGDPRRPFANIRMGTVGNIPMPSIAGSKADLVKHDRVVQLVRSMEAGSSFGGAEDMEIESLLRDLWGMSGDDGVYIAKELSKLPQFGKLAMMATPTPGSGPTPNRSRQRRRVTGPIGQPTPPN